jgi:23S rRNA (adenine2503-C2)-methyltransferase
LATEEIVGQFLQAQAWLSENRPGDDRILNIVYMGQGEPLHNFEAVKKSAMIFMSQHGLSLAGHKITVSTAGYIPGLERWKAEMPDVNIALSLHSPFPEKRDQLIPINRRYPLQKVLELVDGIPSGKKRFVTYEYLLIKDFNDSPEDARVTGELLAGKKAYINLIPFNPFPGSRYERPNPDVVESFKRILDVYKIPTLVRTTKGDQILAACGQLNTGRKAAPVAQLL